MAAGKHSKALTKRFLDTVAIIAKNNGIDHREIVSNVGVQFSNFSFMKTGQKFTTIDHAVELCLQYKVSANWLLLGIGNMFDVSKTKDPIELIKLAIVDLEKGRRTKKK